MSNMTNQQDQGWICECGRGFNKRAGLSVHGRTCPVERRRSQLFCEAIEQGVPPTRVIAHWRSIGRPL